MFGVSKELIASHPNIEEFDNSIHSSTQKTKIFDKLKAIDLCLLGFYLISRQRRSFIPSISIYYLHVNNSIEGGGNKFISRSFSREPTAISYFLSMVIICNSCLLFAIIIQTEYLDLTIFIATQNLIISTF